MKIYSKSKITNKDLYYNRLPLPTQVQILGKYLQEHIDSADKTKRKQPPNEYIIYLTIYYMIDTETRKRMSRYPDKLHNVEQKIYEMPIYINVTTYGKYIRVNVIQLDKYEITLGYLRLDPEDLISLSDCQRRIMEFIKTKIESHYKDQYYEVLI